MALLLHESTVSNFHNRQDGMVYNTPLKRFHSGTSNPLTLEPSLLTDPTLMSLASNLVSFSPGCPGSQSFFEPALFFACLEGVARFFAVTFFFLFPTIFLTGFFFASIAFFP